MSRLGVRVRLMGVVALAAGLSVHMTTTASAFYYCEGGDGATDGRPTACNFGWVAGTAYGGITYKGNAHWWMKFYWDQQATLNTLRSDGKARLELEPYKKSTICDKFSYTSPALRNVTFPNWRHFQSPPKNGCGSPTVKEEWKVEFTNTKNWPLHAAYQLSADMNTHPPLGEAGAEANVSWVRVRPLGPDPDIWLGKLTGFCDLGNGNWSPCSGQPHSPPSEPEYRSTLGFAYPRCP